ncbi:MAG TPA: vitamin K epoxide reductase family protein [Prolixibacteraceae bacterium]|nr:vitamin K epoxide reductase family protein [Prolixibacteraceae bacterium]
METNKNNNHSFWPWWRICLIVLILMAIIVSFILCWHFFQSGSMAGCRGGSPCNEVLNSRWSVLFGVLPVSGLALGTYLAMLFAVFYIEKETELSISRMAWGTMLVLTGSISGSAIWFTIVQKWFIGSFCPYCMTAHIIGLILTALIVWRATKETGIHLNETPLTNQATVETNTTVATKRIISTKLMISLVLIGLALSGIVAVFQIKFTPMPLNSKGEQTNNLPSIDYQTAPIIGSPSARYIITVLFDYQCSHCQKIHFMLNDVVSQYNGKLAFVLCPTPLNTQCNPFIPRDVDAFKNSCELAKVSLAVWLSNHEAFHELDNWMFTFESGNGWKPRSLEDAISKAVELIGHEKFNAAWTNPWIEDYIQLSVQLFGQTIQGGKGGIPKIIFGSKWVIPEPYNSEDLVDILQNSLFVPKP